MASERVLKAKAGVIDKNDEDWQTGLELLKNGVIKDSLSNIILILRHDKKLQGIAYNQHSDCIDVKGDLPWKQVKAGWSDSDLAGAKAYLDGIYHLWSPGKFKDALLAVTAERAYHPIRDYFNALPEWDGTQRLDTLLVEFLGAEDNSYTRAIVRKTLCAAVARIYQPGIKFDYILVLNGPQGIGKEAANLKKADSYEITAIMFKIAHWKPYDGTKSTAIRFPILDKHRVEKSQKGRESHGRVVAACR